MPYNIIIFKAAEDEIKTVYEYYAEISVELGERFILQMTYAIEKLKRTPYNYFVLEDFYHRRIKVQHFPYAILYNIEDNLVKVKMLFGQKDDPNKIIPRMKI